MPDLSYLLKPKYIIAIVLSTIGFLLMYIATGGNVDIIVWDHQFSVSGAEQLFYFVVGFVLLVGTSLYLYRDRLAEASDEVTFGEPSIARFMFHSSASAPLWLGIRLYLGFEWLAAGEHKIRDSAWRNGDSLEGYWTRAVAIPEEGRPPITYAGWREFLQYMIDHNWADWFTWIIVLGEIAVGVGLIVGALTGVAAFFGATMNMSFLLSGSSSSNPVLLILAILVIMGWRVAGYIGLDRWLLPMLGTPWTRGMDAPAVAPTGGRRAAAATGD